MNDRADDAKRAKKKAEPQQKSDKPVWIGFVDIYMSDADKVACKAATVDFDAVWHDVEDLVESGYKVSMSFDENNTTWNISATCNRAGDPNAGYTMSGRGGSFASAVRAFWYKHTVMLAERWSGHAVQQKKGMASDEFG